MRKGMGRNTHYLYADNQKPLSGKEYPLKKTVSAITDRDGNKDYDKPYFRVSYEDGQEEDMNLRDVKRYLMQSQS